MMMMVSFNKKLLLLCVVVVAAVTNSKANAAAATTTTTTASRCSAQAQPYSYIALAQYPLAVHLLDANLKVMDTLPFAAIRGFANGIVTDGQLIYIAVANSDQLHIMDYTGQMPVTTPVTTTTAAITAGIAAAGAADDGATATATAAGWAITPSPNYGVSSAEFVDGDLALTFSGPGYCVSPIVRYFDKSTGLRKKKSLKLAIRDVDDCPEGMAYDGKTLWLLGNAIDGYDPKNNNSTTNGGAPIIAKLSNPAAGGVCDYQGTGMGFEAATNSLIVACLDGQWFRVSIETGEVIDSGKIGLFMTGLKATNC